MASKAATNADSPEAREESDGPLMDAAAAVKKLVQRGKERGFVQQIRQFGARKPGRAAGNDRQIHSRQEFHILRVNLQDRFASAHVRQIDRDLAVETSRPQQRRIEHVWAIGRRNDDDAFLRIETVHLHEQRIQRLFAFIVAADTHRAAA